MPWFIDRIDSKYMEAREKKKKSPGDTTRKQYDINKLPHNIMAFI